MFMHKIGVIMSLILSFGTQTYGQASTNVTGVVRDANGKNLSGATIQLATSRDTLHTLTKVDGTFTFYIKTSGTFKLSISMKGYFSSEILFEPDTNRTSLVFPPIILVSHYEELTPILVMGVKPIIIKDDTTEYRASAFKLRAGSDLERLLRQLPGIDWDTGGNVLVEGKQIRTIKINGQDLIGGDLKTLLRTLPADIIEKIQIIDDFGDKSRLTGVKSGEADKTLNIVTKQNKRNGGIATIEEGAGNQNKYISSLYSTLFRGDRQFTLNGRLSNNSPAGSIYEKLIYLRYADKWSPKWSGNAGGSFWGNDNNVGSSIIQDNNFGQSRLQQNQNTSTSGNSRNSTSSYVLTFAPNSSTKLRIFSSLGTYFNKQSQAIASSSSEYDSASTKLTSGNSNNQSKSSRLTLQSNIYFEQLSTRSKNRLSVDASYSYSQERTSEDNLTQTTIQLDSVKSESKQRYVILTTNFNREFVAKFHYYVAIGKASLLDFGNNNNYSTTQNNRVTQVPRSVNEEPETIDSQTINYVFRNLSNGFSIGYLAHMRNINVALSSESVANMIEGKSLNKNGTNKYRYFSILPEAQVTFTLAERENLHFLYKSKSIAPFIEQLNPVLDLSNPQYPVQGNPNLKPSFNQYLSLSYNRHSSPGKNYMELELGLSYETTKAAVISNLTHPVDTSSVVQKTTYINENGLNSFGIEYRWSLPSIFSNKFHTTIFGTISNNAIPSMVDSVHYRSNNLIAAQNIKINWIIPGLLESSLLGSYTYNFTHYTSPLSQLYSTSNIHWYFDCRQVLFNHWVFTSSLSQMLTGNSHGGLRSAPILLNTAIQRELFQNNQAKISISINNLLNSIAGINQIITPTSVIQKTNTLIGRYYLLTILVKLQKFK